MRLTLLGCLLASFGYAAEVVSPAERAEIATLIEAVVHAGFPDGKTLKLYGGELHIRATSGPQGEEPLLPCDASTMQETSGKGIAYRFTFPGMHAKSASDSWLIAFSYQYAPRPTDTVVETDLVAIDPATLTAIAHAARAFDAATQAESWLSPLSAVDRPRVIAAMDHLVPVSFYLKIGPDQWPAAAALLYRAGWSDAEDVGLSVADQRARSFWQMRPWSEPDIAFDPTGVYANSKSEEHAWNDAHPTLTLESPATAWRRGLYRFCKAQISCDDPWLSAGVAAACCLACLDPHDPQGNNARIKALRVARDLPLTVPAGASVADRLQSWEGAPRSPRMSVSNGKVDGKGSVSMSTSFSTPAAAYTPVAADLDVLVTLLDNPHPSRWIDFTGARSIGDNAWRALAVLFKQDPRIRAGIATDKPWTVTERSAAARAFQGWWKQHGAEQRAALTP